MKSEFSELSFAFAYMADLRNKLSGTLSVAPSFPSTTLEGKKGYGYDVRLGLKGIPVFLQFKLAHCMKSGNSAEFSKGVFSQGSPVNPVYRFYLMALGKSRQTSLMLKLEKRHDLVFYVAPAFHKVSELNSHFASSSVDSHSRSIRPSSIKKMPDKLEHFVSYRLSGPCHRFSDDPAMVEEEPEDLPAAIEGADARDTNAAAVLDSLLSILDDRGRSKKGKLAELASAERDPTVAAQFVARTFFGCELAFFSRE
ncbi:hypothetical protein EDF74_0336 [Stenotrophomonas rhizophila]|uniref:hypothetical protein n=1 Tax=Stenotrophomonas rhizophila TaxID=216778 RepID=UPI000FB60185|nr:hypothetical protein [Stenotrophomonas rhizophila]ROP79290.1 hypothetical protein EDF74_0336 [Stenotrophomonas rhizophila]